MAGGLGTMAYLLMRAKVTGPGDTGGKANQVQAKGDETRQKQIEAAKKQEGQAQQMLRPVRSH